jgi:hypothetical protein
LALLRDVNPKEFWYVAGYGDEGRRQQFGLMAEDLADVEPRFVGFDKQGRPNSVDWPNFTWVLVNAVKELDARLQRMENRRK